MVLCFLLGLWQLIWIWPKLKRTTLAGAWWWALASLVAVLWALASLVAVALKHSGEEPATWSAPVWFIGATSTFCPGVFVLGARRPHAGAWHFVVLALWLMLALPAIEVLILSRGFALELGPVRGWFLWLAIAIVGLNYLPTRHWPSALLFAGGQVLMLWRYLPVAMSWSLSDVATEVYGTALIVAALVIAAQRRPRRNTGLDRLDAAWLSFRDAFGALWSLRVLQRINEASRSLGWPVSLGWWGFDFHNGARMWSDVNEKTIAEIWQTLDNLLRRFVDQSELQKSAESPKNAN
jgi:hypothetical protein